MSKPGEIKNLSKLIQPQVGIITNIEINSLPNGINFTIRNAPDSLNGSAQIAIEIGGTPSDDNLSEYDVEISAINGYTGIKESSIFSDKTSRIWSSLNIYKTRNRHSTIS